MDLREVVEISKELLNSTNQLQRQKASEVVTFMLGDVNRLWNAEQVNAVPVGYFMRGYSLPTRVMRNLLQDCHQKLHAAGVQVACDVMDGEWADIVFHDDYGKPTTVLQLKRDVFKAIDQTKKNKFGGILQGHQIVALGKNRNNCDNS